MKISQLQMQAVNTYRLQEVQAKKAAHTRRTNDQLEISPKAKQLSTPTSFEQVRQQKVETLKAEIQSGDYEINKRQLAENLLRHYRL